MGHSEKDLILRNLDPWLREGVKRVSIGVERGMIDAGALNVFNVSPLMILCCEGRADYFVMRERRTARVSLEPGEMLVMARGTWIGATPRHDYLSLGVGLAEQHLHAYLMRTDRNPVSPASVTTREMAIPCNGIYRLVQSAVFDHPTQVSADQLSLFDTLCLGARRPPKDPFLSTLGALLLREMKSILVQTKPDSVSKSKAIFLAACAEIGRAPGGSVNREALAGALGVHPQYLSRLFQRYAGKNFNAYLREFRLGRAAELLERGGYSVVEVAAALGFSSDAYFVHCFRKRFGHTPGRHRPRP